MAKVALLIGVSDYQPGLNPLPSAERDIAALQSVLKNEAIGCFDMVKTLANPALQVLQDAVYELFEQCSKDDLVLLYFSGHGVKDQSLELFLTTPQTRKNEQGLVVPHTAVSARYLRERFTASRCRRTVVILDCCYSGAFAKGMTAKDGGKVDIGQQLGGQGRAILTSSTSVQSSFQQEERPLSIYTHYLVEGLKTGAADLDGDGQISADELHRYTHQKVTEESPAMTPEFYPVKDGHRIFLARAPQDDPLLLYRREVRRLVEEDDGAIDFMTGKFDVFDRKLLDARIQDWRIPPEAAKQIEHEIIEPLRQRHQKLKDYEAMYQQAVQRCWPISGRVSRRLKELQGVWGLRDKDIEPIEERLKPKETAQPKVQPLVSKPKERPDFATPPTAKPIVRASTAETTKRWLSAITRPWDDGEKLDQVELKSAKGADYQQLRDFLKQQEWRKADEETRRLMLEVGDPDNKDYLDYENVEKFPCEDLRTINELWTVASNGHFGFSVQKQIWQRVGGKVDVGTERKLGDALGWRVDGNWLNYSDLTFDSSAPEGHLPASVWCLGFFGGRVGFVWLVLFSRVETCEL
ncbi:MAG: Clp protease [Spirulina sp. SIO3F2]|nr:Clp protease [Spirulina sp. SIO3F2]